MKQESEIVKKRRLALQKRVSLFYEVDPFHRFISLPASGEIHEDIADAVEELKSLGYGVQFEMDLRFSTTGTHQEHA